MLKFMNLRNFQVDVVDLFDKKVNIEIDNGNHLVFSANENFMDFCKTIGTTNTLKEIPADFNFMTLNQIKNGI